ncbi:MAG: glycoside hydrolase family 3 protein [Puniceicoccaceae bacterium]
MSHPDIPQIIKNLSLEEKVGAVLTLAFNGTQVTPNILEYVTRYQCGGLRLTPNIREFGDYIDPETNEVVVNIRNDQYFFKKGIAPPEVTAAEYKATLDELQRVARARKSGLPLHFSCDQEGDGTEANCVFKNVKIFPKPMGLRATGEKEMAYRVALATARQLRAIGFNYIHSPVLDVSVNPANPEVYNRAFSDDPAVVAEWAAELCRGYREGDVIATGKHFPGRGDSAVDAHFKIPEIHADLETLWERDLLPYRELIQQGLLPSIMLAHSIFPAIDPDHIATVSKPVVTGLLREKLGFEGVITTDSMTMGGLALRHGVPTACAMSLAAGADLVLMKAQNHFVGECYQEIMDWVVSGKIPEAELDTKVERILNLKAQYGLFEDTPDSGDPEAVGNEAEVVELAKEVAVNSLASLKMSKEALPLPQDQPILVIEPLYTLSNNAYSYPGMLFHACLAHNPNCVYLEVALRADEEDEKRLQTLTQKYDTIVFVSNYGRGVGSNRKQLEELLRQEGKTVIVVTNTPYGLSIPPEAENVLLSVGYTKECMQAVADHLFADGPANGILPVANSDVL